jgi:hypothetical protein
MAEVVGLMSLPEEVLIKIAQHLGKWPELAEAVVQIQNTESGAGSMHCKDKMPKI